MKNEIIYQKLLEFEKLINLSANTVIDVGAAAEFLHTTKSSIYRLVHSRKIPLK